VNNRQPCPQRISLAILFIFLSLIWATPAFSWADKTHLVINETALLKLPEDFPSFLKEQKSWMIYLGPEPDRWKEPDAYTLKKDTSPDHYIDLDKIEKSDIRRDRFSYMKAIQKGGLDLDEVGFSHLPLLKPMKNCWCHLRITGGAAQLKKRSLLKTT
jgi:hypothetical protein